MDLKLSSSVDYDIDHDLDLTNGELSLVTGIAGVAQAITMKLRTWLGESKYDRNAGVPYMQVIFKRGVRLEAVRFILEQIILSVPGVTEVVDLDFNLDSASREVTITGRVSALDEETTFAV